MPTLYRHQQDLVDRAPDKHGLWLKMRCGKTPTAIRLASTRAKSAIVICPRSIRSQWEREINVWNNSDCVFYVRSKEDIRLHKNIPMGVEAFIWDEVNLAGANYKSKTFKEAEKYLKINNCKFVWLLTGTPVPASSWSVYSYGLLLGKKWNWWKWSNEFFTQIRMGQRTIPVPKTDKKTQAKLQTIIRSIGTVIDLKDITEVMADEDIIETFILNKQQKDLIENIDAVLPITRYGHQHQLESGVKKTDGYTENLIFECAKDDRLAEIVAESDKIIIVCRYLNQIDKYIKMFSDKYKVFEISGRIKEQAGDVAVKAENSPTAVVIVQGDTCVGYSLKSFNTMVFASMSYSFVSYDQMRSRVKAIGKLEPCVYIHLLTEGNSMDKAVYDCVQKKNDFNFNLYNPNL